MHNHLRPSSRLILKPLDFHAAKRLDILKLAYRACKRAHQWHDVIFAASGRRHSFGLGLLRLRAQTGRAGNAGQQAQR